MNFDSGHFFAWQELRLCDNPHISAYFRHFVRESDGFVHFCFHVHVFVEWFFGPSFRPLKVFMAVGKRAIFGSIINVGAREQASTSLFFAQRKKRRRKISCKMITTKRLDALACRS